MPEQQQTSGLAITRRLWTLSTPIIGIDVLGFALELGELGVWLSFPIAIAVKASVNFIAYKREHWVVTGVRLPQYPPPQRWSTVCTQS